MSLIDKASLIQIPSGYKSTKLYSIEPTNGDGDFTFSRSSSATRVNSEGLIEVASVLGSEEVINGNFATDSDWTKGSGWTISGGTASQDNSTPNSGDLTQSNVTTSGKKYKVTFDLVVTSGTISALVGGHNLFTSSGTKTFIKTATSSNLTFRNYSNFIGSIDNVSVKEVIENDVPRLDYSGGASCASLLLEGQTQNLVTYSEDFSQWSTLSANAATYVSDLVNPDGSVGGYKVSGSGIYLGISLLATTQRSIYARSVSGSGDVQLFTHSSNTNNVFTLTEEWQRFDINSTTSASAVGNYYIDLRGASSTLSELYVWGAQATNDQSYPTSYIPTSGSTVTRSADVCNGAGTSATFNSTEGVLFAEIAALANDGTNRGIAISDGTSSNRVLIYYTTTTNQITALYTYNGTTQVSINKTFTDSTQFSKCAFKYKENDCAFWIDGVEVGADNTATAFAADTLDTLNFDSGAGGSDFYGKTKQLMVFNEALSDEELSDLTGQVNLSFNNLATFYGYTIL